MAKPLPPDYPARWMLEDGHTTTPNKDIYKETCYICNDPEYSAMGLPLCYACHYCGGHVAADDVICDDCGKDNQPYPCPYCEETTRGSDEVCESCGKNLNDFVPEQNDA